jgi:hypothetical protein
MDNMASAQYTFNPIKSFERKENIIAQDEMQ